MLRQKNKIKIKGQQDDLAHLHILLLISLQKEFHTCFVFTLVCADVCVCVTHAERPSTSSLVGMMPFLLRTAAALSTSPRSTALISRSSYLFQSVF